MAGFEMKAFPLITHIKWSFLMEGAIEVKEILQWQLEFQALTIKNSTVLA